MNLVVQDLIVRRYEGLADCEFWCMQEYACVPGRKPTIYIVRRKKPLLIMLDQRVLTRPDKQDILTRLIADAILVRSGLHKGMERRSWKDM